MRKVGYFFAAFLPLVLVIGIQFIASCFLFGFAGLFLSWGQRDASGIDAILELSRNMNFNYVLMITYAIISIVVFGLWYYYSCGGDFLPKASETFSGLQLFGVITIVPGTQFACTFLMAFVAALMPSWMENYEKLMESAGLDDTITIPIFLYAVLLGPICEELIFRGVTLRLARQALPFGLANLLQAILFGAFHMNWIQGIYAFALGLLLGFVCEMGDSIYYSILLHILFNFWGTVIAPLLSDIEDETLMILSMLGGMVLSLGVGLFLFIFGIRRRRARIRQARNEQCPDPVSRYS